MKIITESLSFSTKGEIEVINLSDKIEPVLKKAKLKDGILCLSAMGSTCALTTCEDEAGLISDLKATLERLIPRHKGYEHDSMLDNGNAHSHLRSSLIGSTLSVPFSGGELRLGTWQQIVFIELDNRPRQRKVVLQFLGE